MEGLLSLLLFAAFFYVMMRWGCGAHMVHGHGHGGGHGDAGEGGHGAAATDPVCGMTVNPGEGYTKAHAGREFRFCSRACLDKFEAAPEQYVEKGEAKA